MTAFYKQSWFAPVAGAATTFLFPSLGESVGAGANSLLGGALGTGTANALGSAIVGGGIGALSNGAQGALTGGLAGGLTSGLMSATGLNGGLSGLMSNGSFSGAAQNPIASGAGANATGVAERAGEAAGAASKGGGGVSSVLGGNLMSPGMIAGLALAGTMGSAMMGGKQQQQGAPAQATDPNMTRGLSQVSFNRTQRPMEGDPRTYGMRGQHSFFDNNALPAARGGRIQAYADGGAVGALQAASLPPQAMMGQGPGQAPMGQMMMGPGRGGGGGQPNQMAAMMAQQNGRAPFAEGGRASASDRLLQQIREQELARQQAGRRMPPDGAPPMRGPSAPGAPLSSMPSWMRYVPGSFDQHEERFARGGVSGPGTGRSDDIPAVLSDGEYVIDAETVALLGDGSSKAGAQKLDELRARVRQHKGGALSRGKISPDAKPALSYIGGR